MAIFGRRGLLKALPFAGVAALSAQPPVSRSLEDRLRTAIDKLEVVNTHEHTLPESERMAQAIDFFTLAGHYAINDLISAGLPAESLQVINNPEAPEAERWRRFEEYWKFARFTGYSEALRIAIRDIYSVDRISGATIGRINQAIRTRNRPGLYRYVFKERSRIRFSVLDDYWNIAPVRPDPEFFVLAHKFDRFVIPWTREDIARLEKATAMSIGSLRDLVRAMEENFRQNLAAGMVTVKTTLAYERELLFGEAQETDAARDFARMIRGGEVLPQGFRRRTVRPFRNMEDYMFHQVLRTADAHGVPVQIHTGLTAGNGNFVQNSDPRHLTNLFFLYPRIQFDLFHVSYPFEGELSVLAKLFPNVHADFCWTHIVSPEVARRTLHTFLETIPVNKIFGFGGDYRYPELSYAHLQMAKRNIARVLAEKVQAGFCTETEAAEIAGLVLLENPMRLFKPRARTG